MLDNAAPAQPEVTAPGGQTAPDLDSQLDAIYDKMMPDEAAKKPAVEEAPEIKETIGEPEAKADPKLADPAKLTDDKAPEAPTEPTEVRPPHAWAAEYKGSFNQIPQKLQSYIAQRETESQRKITTLAQEAKGYAPVKAAFDEFRQWVAPGKEAEVTRNLLAAQAMIDQNPVQGLRMLAETYGLTKDQLAHAFGITGQAQQPASTGDADLDDLFKDPRLDKQVMPVLQQMQSANQRLQAEIAELKSQQMRRESMEGSQRLRSVESTIAEFSAGKEDWSSVAEDVVKEVQFLRAQKPDATTKELLEEAYDRARWANPEIRQRILMDQRKAEEAAKAKEQARLAAEARKASTMNVRSGASSSTATFDGRWDATDKLAALYDRIQSR